ncbi:MAG: hypothetical protein OXU45_08160 [Candidatus Melainabacteria bacterium]|nr:hypothetical protein [Candidatus Melainabacteria bacterium]
MVHRLGFVPPDSSEQSSSQTETRSTPIEEQYAQLREKYTDLQLRLQELKILDKKLRQEIRSITQEMLAVRDEYRQAVQEQKLLNGAAEADGESLYQTTPATLMPKLAQIDRHIDDVWSEIRRELVGAGLAAADDEPKVREKTAREKVLDGIRADYATAKDYNNKSVDELELDFENLKKEREGLEFIGHWMVVLGAHAFNLERKIPERIDNYWKLGTADSNRVVANAPGALEDRAQKEINGIAMQIFAYDARIKKLQELEKAAREITRRAEAADDRFSFTGPAGELDEVLDTLVELIEEALQGYGMLDKSAGGDAFVRGVVRSITDLKPKDGEELTKLVTIMLLTATMKTEGTYSLAKNDVSKIRSMFHPDRFNAKIEALKLDSDSKQKLKGAIVTFFKVADEVCKSAYFA